MQRFVVLPVVALVLAACGGGAPTAPTAPTSTASATQAAVATAPATAAPTPAPVLTNPPPTQIPGCLPQCWQGRLTRPGSISGTYKTKNFFGGNLTVTLPTGWFGYEDSTGELAVGLPNQETWRLEFWIDMYAVKDTSGAKDAAVDMSGDSMLAWFLDKPLIHVIKRQDVVLDGIPAVSVEYRRNDKAATEDAGCPPEIQPCTVAFSYPEFNGEWFGEGGPFHSKLIVGSAMWGGQEHTIYVSFAAADPDYDQVIADVDAVIASMQLPDGVGPAK